jgi:hypothetical protein
MIFSNYDEQPPISDEDCKDYFRGLYKVVKMRYEEDILRYENETKCNFDDYYNNENDENNDEDLYLKYKFI